MRSILRSFVLAIFFFGLPGCSSSSSSPSTVSPDSGAIDDSGSGADAGSDASIGVGDGGDQQIAGSLTAPTSCNEVCATTGLACDDNYDWGTDLNGVDGSVAAGQLEYHDSTDGSALYGVDCASVPAKTKDLSGSGNPAELGTLTYFECACK